MNSPVQEDLLGYVLGALDATEERDIQQKIEQDPALQEEVRKLKASLVPLDFLDAPSGLRTGLARRTCEWVAGTTKNPDFTESTNYVDHLATLADDQAVNETAAAQSTDNVDFDNSNVDDQKVTLSPSRFELLHPQTWSMTDAIAGIAIVAVLSGILFPTLSWQRFNSRKLACQDNLRNVGMALMQYSDNHGGQFVAIPSAGKLSASGLFAPMLKDAGLIEDDRVFSCAGVDQDAPVFIPSLAQLESADGEQLDYLKRNMAGHFGYSMGYTDGNEYRPLTNSGLTNTVLVADRPSFKQPDRRSMNHGAWGQNCLFGDGRVEFIKGDSVGEDAIFVNDYGVVAPGTSPRDSVIAPSHLSPATR